MKADALIRFMLLGNRSWEEFAILLARISLGAFWAFGSDVEHNVLYVTLSAFPGRRAFSGVWLRLRRLPACRLSSCGVLELLEAVIIRCSLHQHFQKLPPLTLRHSQKGLPLLTCHIITVEHFN